MYDQARTRLKKAMLAWSMCLLRSSTIRWHKHSLRQLATRFADHGRECIGPRGDWNERNTRGLIANIETTVIVTPVF